MVAPIIPTMPAGIPLAALTTIDFQKLRSDDADEKQKLWQAATEAGFFYLNYENMPEFEDLAATVNGIYKLEHELFDLPDEFKMNYDVDKQGTMKLSGYKPIGRNIGGLPGNRDGHESWAIPKNAIFNLNPTQYAYPPLLSSHLPLRPEMGTKVRVMGESDEEEEVLIEEWIGRKFGVLRKETFRRGEEWVLTGRKGKGGIAT
ncbi:2og-fe oxygenase protein [Pyrenophora tritici-repentis]|nr:2og-fe oxygenase protein [Pyrenophora tritici-repentis]